MSAIKDLLEEIEAFIGATGMGEAYFGQVAVGNSKLLPRLREGRSIQVETAEKVRAFIRARSDEKVAASAEPAS